MDQNINKTTPELDDFCQNTQKKKQKTGSPDDPLIG
jgi:hypothetical protein